MKDKLTKWINELSQDGGDTKASVKADMEVYLAENMEWLEFVSHFSFGGKTTKPLTQLLAETDFRNLQSDTDENAERMIREGLQSKIDKAIEGLNQVGLDSLEEDNKILIGTALQILRSDDNE